MQQCLPDEVKECLKS